MNKQSNKSISYLIESELEKAEIILAAKSITSKLKDMAEQLAKLEANDVIPLGDAMRDIFGSEESTKFETAVVERIRSLTEALRTDRNAISDLIDALENGQPIASDMASMSEEDIFPEEDSAPEELTDNIDTDDDSTDAESEDDADLENDLFGGDDESGAAGRLQKESVDADRALAKEFVVHLREGKTAAEATKLLSERYAISQRMIVDIIKSK